MHLISFGCSLIFGTDLPDDGRHNAWPTASELTWPALLAKKNGLEYKSMAKGGSGNLCVLDRVMRTACSVADAVFIIGWTYIDRFDFSDPRGQHFGNGSDDYRTLRPAEDSNLERCYYSQMHSQYKDKFTNLLYINSAIGFLQNRKIPFVMTAIDDMLFCEKWHAPPPVLDLQQQVRPYISNFEGRNFIDWSRHRGFEISPTGHPLEQAHAAAADLMAPAIDAILRRA